VFPWGIASLIGEICAEAAAVDLVGVGLGAGGEDRMVPGGRGGEGKSLGFRRREGRSSDSIGAHPSPESKKISVCSGEGGSASERRMSIGVRDWGEE
jgi:hypothetical protein